MALVFLALAFCPTGSAAAAEPLPEPNTSLGVTVVVRGPANDSPLRTGDRLLTWRGRTRSGGAEEKSGTFEHPFEVLALAHEVPGLRSLIIGIEREGEALEVPWDEETWPFFAQLDSRPPRADRLDQAWRHFESARQLQNDGETSRATDRWNAALRAAAGTPQVEATLLYRWALAHDLAGRNQIATDLYQRCAELLRQHSPGGLALAAALDGQGTSALRQGKLLESAPVLEEAVRLRRQIAPGSNVLRLALSHLGVVYNRLGRLDDSRAISEECLALVRQLDPQSLREASALNNLGTLAYERGDLASSEEYLRAAKEIRQRLAPESTALAQSLNNLGALMEERGDSVKAEAWYRQALELRRQLQPRSEVVVSSLSNLAVLLAKRDSSAEAIDFATEATTIAKTLGPTTTTEAWAQKILAYVLSNSAEPSTAELGAAQAAALRATSIWQDLISRDQATESLETADAWATLGDVHLRQGELDEAEAAARRAMAIRSQQSPGSRWEAESWQALAAIESRRGNLELAVERQQQAIALIESSSGPAGETPREQARAAAESVDWYRQSSLWLAALGRPEAAFEISERARARALLATLAERRLSFAGDLPADLETARQQLAASREAAWQELNESRSTTAHSAARMRLNELQDEQDLLERRIRELSPRLAELRRPAPITAARAQRSIEPGTVLLAWVVGDEESLLLAIDRGASGARLSAYRLDLGAAELAPRIELWRALLEQPTGHTEGNVEQLGRELWNALLAPAEDLLAIAQRLIVVPDRALQNLPFAALVDSQGRYLVERLPLSRAPSATVALRRDRRPVAITRSLVALGDPRPAEDPLVWSRFEVETLGQQHPGPTRVLTGHAASERAFKNLQGEPGFIHFAGHTELQDLLPMDSHLRLAAGDGDDGRLQVWEIFEELRINAELVTLSSCSSSLGQEVDGEGLAGLARAFVFAGARAVVSSQWQVEDRPTALLMIRFYHHLAQGLALDQALRQAQLDLLQDRVDWPETTEKSWLDRLLSWAGWGASSDSAEDPSSLAHPGRWAGFELILGGD